MFSQIEYFFKRSVFLGIFRFSVFLFLFIVSRYLYFYLGTWQLVLPELNSVIESLRSLILHVSAAFFSLFYHNVSIAPDGVLAFGGKGFIQVIYGCTGIIQISQITIILLLYPISWRQKLYLFPLSIVIMIVAAIIHFLILVPIAYHFPGWFPLFHNHLSRIIFFGIVFVTWLFWERVRIDKPAVSVNSSDKSISPGQGVIVNRIRPDQRKNRLTRMVALLAINALVIFYVTVIAAPLGASFPWLQKIIYFEKIVSFMLLMI